MHIKVLWNVHLKIIYFFLPIMTVLPFLTHVSMIAVKQQCQQSYWWVFPHYGGRRQGGRIPTGQTGSDWTGCCNPHTHLITSVWDELLLSSSQQKNPNPQHTSHGTLITGDTQHQLLWHNNLVSKICSERPDEQNCHISDVLINFIFF